MAIDASIYQALRPIQMPSPLESQSRALQVTGQTMQNMATAKQIQAADAEAQRKRIASIGEALEGISGLSEQQRAAAYPKMRESLISQGLIRPQDAPEEYDPGLYRQTLMGWRNSDAYLEREFKRAQTEKLRSEAAYAAREKKSGTKLPADKVMALASARQVPALLDDLKTTVEANEGSFGPVAGRLSMMNPYSETAKTIDAQTRTVRQTIGKLKEGGVLRKEDEEKYAKMLPEMTDTPAVARNKIELVRREMMRDFQSNVSALADAGYDVSAFGDSFNQTVPDLPSAIAGKSKSGFGPTARASEPSPEDMEALHWLRRNPNSPDAAGVRARLERKGLL